MEGMMKDYSQESAEIVAISFENGRPTIYRASYSPEYWVQVVTHCKLSSDMKHARFVRDDSEDGQAIINGTAAQDITMSYLLGISAKQLEQMAESYGVGATGARKAVAFRILSAVADKVKPK